LANFLFESAGKVVGKHCIAVILSGLYRDEARGARSIKARPEAVFVESARNKSVPSIPLNVLGDAINNQVNLSNKKLLERRREE
jgi:chemotaxis response regulator CheB